MQPEGHRQNSGCHLQSEQNITHYCTCVSLNSAQTAIQQGRGQERLHSQYDINHFLNITVMASVDLCMLHFRVTRFFIPAQHLHHHRLFRQLAHLPLWVYSNWENSTCGSVVCHGSLQRHRNGTTMRKLATHSSEHHKGN